MMAAGRVLLAIGAVAFTTLTFSATALATELKGNLQWYQKAPLTTAVSGVIVAVAVDVGDKVQQGQTLLQLDERLPRAQLKAREALLKAAQNALEEAQRELERTQEMYDQTLLADHDLQLAMIARDAADAELQQAEAKLLKAQLAVEYSVLRAPFDGRVVSRQAVVGQSINHELQQQPLLEIADATQMVAQVQATAAQLAGLPLGKAVRVLVDDVEFAGEVARVGAEPVPGWAGNYAVDIRFQPAGQLLFVGQQARVVY